MVAPDSSRAFGKVHCNLGRRQRLSHAFCLPGKESGYLFCLFVCLLCLAIEMKLLLITFLSCSPAPFLVLWLKILLGFVFALLCCCLCVHFCFKGAGFLISKSGGIGHRSNSSLPLTSLGSLYLSSLLSPTFNLLFKIWIYRDNQFFVSLSYQLKK